MAVVVLKSLTALLTELLKSKEKLEEQHSSARASGYTKRLD
jgi:hypothetical protein